MVRSLNISGKVYTLVLCENQIEVDPEQMQGLGGIIDSCKKEIRVQDGGCTQEDTFEYLLHEVIHGIEATFMLKNLDHEHVHLLAIGLADFLVRNEWIDLDNLMEKLRAEQESVGHDDGPRNKEVRRHNEIIKALTSRGRQHR